MYATAHATLLLPFHTCFYYTKTNNLDTLKGTNMFRHAIESMTRGLKIISICFATLFKHPRFFFFPFVTTSIIFSFIGFLFFVAHITIGMDGLLEFLDLFSKKTPSTPEIEDYIFLIISGTIINFLFIILSTIIAVATAHITFNILNNRHVNFRESIFHSLKKINIILKWSLLSTVMSILIRNQKKNQFFAVSLLQAIGALAWDVATFFMMPVIAFEQMGLIDSIKQSAHTMRKSFGESATGAIGLGIISSLFIFPLPIGIFTIIILQKNLGISHQTQIGLAIGSFLVTLTLLMMLFNTIKTIFKTAVYSYTHGYQTGPFSTALIKKSFK